MFKGFTNLINFFFDFLQLGRTNTDDKVERMRMTTMMIMQDLTEEGLLDLAMAVERCILRMM